MKDKELRREVDERFKELKMMGLGVSIKYCKECKHDTMHAGHPRRRYGAYYFSASWEPQTEDFHRCLNCGTDWVYETEIVAREYKPPKKNAKQKGG